MKPGTAFRRWELMGARQTSPAPNTPSPGTPQRRGSFLSGWGPPKLSHAMPDDWSHEETDLYADRRNFYEVEKWSRDGQRIEEWYCDPSRRMNFRSYRAAAKSQGWALRIISRCTSEEVMLVFGEGGAF